MNRCQRSLRYTRGYVSGSMHDPLCEPELLWNALREDTDSDTIPGFNDVLSQGTATLFHMKYMCYNFMRKYPFGGNEVDKMDKARNSFLAREALCREVNQSYERFGRFECDQDLKPILHRASHLISSVIGDVNDVDFTSFYLPPGATSFHRRDASQYNKLRGPIEVTQHAIPRFRQFVEANSLWFERYLGRGYEFSRVLDVITPVPGDRISFVEKDVDTHRTIGIGPMFNSIMQRCVGVHLRHRLRRFGIDLHNAAITHGALARLGSVTNQLATVDLSAASDSISFAVILDLFPLPWVQLLDDLRCRRYYLDGRWRSYEKISAMGNGFTFELQTLLFYALSRACCEHLGLHPNVWVFGDDIVVPTECRDVFMRLFTQLGFTINTNKTFFEGPFRESCGAHYYSGHDVKPFYLRRKPDLLEVIRLHNFLYGDGRRYVYRSLFSRVRSLLKKFSCLRGPADVSGTHHISDDRYTTGATYYRLEASNKKLPIGWGKDVDKLVYHLYRCETRQSEEPANQFTYLSTKPSVVRHNVVSANF